MACLEGVHVWGNIRLQASAAVHAVLRQAHLTLQHLAKIAAFLLLPVSALSVTRGYRCVSLFLLWISLHFRH